MDELAVPSFSANVSTYIAISPLRDGGAGHFKHLVHVHIHRKQILPLTHGRFEVNRIVYWDQLHDFVYYLGIPEGRPGQQHLYRVSSLPPKFDVGLKAPECLTCLREANMNMWPGHGGGPAASGRRAPGGVGAPPGAESTQGPVKLGTNWDDVWEEDMIVTLPAHTTPSTPVPSSASASSAASYRRRRPKGKKTEIRQGVPVGRRGFLGGGTIRIY